MTKVCFGVLLQHHSAEMHEGELPDIKPDQMLLQMEICNICTEDYQRWLGLREFDKPMADGHEYTGIIIAKGSDVSDLYQIGDRVGRLNQHCGVCEDCRRGNSSDCKFPGPKMGIGLPDYYGQKAFANYKIIPERLAVKVSKDIPANQAAFLEPLATVINGIKKMKIKPLETVVVIGAGTMGLLNAQVAKLYGARVIITEMVPKKIERAMSAQVGTVINANNINPVEAVKEITNGEGADAVIFAVGNSTAYLQGYEMLKKYRGRLLFFAAGYPKPQFDFDPNDLHYRKMELIGCYNADNPDFFDAARMLGNQQIDVSFSLEGVTIPLREFAKAMEAAAMPNAYRVSIDCQAI